MSESSPDSEHASETESPDNQTSVDGSVTDHHDDPFAVQQHQAEGEGCRKRARAPPSPSSWVERLELVMPLSELRRKMRKPIRVLTGCSGCGSPLLALKASNLRSGSRADMRSRTLPNHPFPLNTVSSPMKPQDYLHHETQESGQVVTACCPIFTHAYQPEPRQQQRVQEHRYSHTHQVPLATSKTLPRALACWTMRLCSCPILNVSAVTPSRVPSPSALRMVYKVCTTTGPCGTPSQAW